MLYLVPPLVQNVSRYNLTIENNLQTIYSRTTQYSDSFLPSAVRDWNNLPCAVRDADSTDAFKQHLNQDRARVPKYYYTGKRKLQIIHIRIRTRCSYLNFDLFPKNNVDRPLCTCGRDDIENADLFFLRCPLYRDYRTKLTNTVLLYTNMTLMYFYPGMKHYPTHRAWQYLKLCEAIFLQRKDLILIQLNATQRQEKLDHT